MNKAKLKAATVIKKVAEKMADRAYGAASMWGLHQIEEPPKPAFIKK